MPKRKKTDASEAVMPSAEDISPTPDEELIPFCAHADTTADAKDTRWDPAIVKRGIGWTVTHDLPNFTRAAFLDLARKAFSRISEVCGLTFFESQGSANIIITTGPVDGPSGVLAWSGLPPANPIEQKYDASEGWNTSVSLLAVLKHELGHAVGLNHDPQRGALLSAYYDPAILDYTSRDIARLQALYGPPIPPTDPSPVPPPTGSGSVIIFEVTNADKIRILNAEGKVARVTW